MKLRSLFIVLALSLLPGCAFFEKRKTDTTPAAEQVVIPANLLRRCPELDLQLSNLDLELAAATFDMGKLYALTHRLMYDFTTCASGKDKLIDAVNELQK